MSVSTPPAPPTPAGTGPTTRGAAPPLGGSASTPTRYRAATAATLVLIGLTALPAFVAASSLTTSSDRALTNTGPVLVATQDVFASIAEADAASAAVFLSGQAEDREQRRLYELALERSTAQLEQVSRLVGDDDAAHESIRTIAAALTRYAGLVEAARLANLESIPGATDRLRAAIAEVQDAIVPEVQAITASAQARLDDDIGGGQAATILTLFVGLAAIGALVAGQVWLSGRTNRVLNLPLLAATGLMVLVAAWLLTAWVRQQDDLELARDGGYDSIALTADIQTTAFRYKTLESLSLISAGDPEEQDALARRLAAVDVGEPSLVDAARRGDATGGGLLLEANRAADSTREQAATAEMLVRWDRYLETSRDIQLALDADERDAAVELAVGEANADFNGFNTSVESVLSDNRTQFTTGLADARNHLDWLRLATVALPIGAALACLWGYGLRIREYRR